jgi:hypothetical protein
LYYIYRQEFLLPSLAHLAVPGGRRLACSFREDDSVPDKSLTVDVRPHLVN